MFFIIEKSEEKTFEFSQNSEMKFANLLGNADNESSKFATRKWYVINDQNNRDYGDGNEMVQPLNLKLRSLNQILVIIQTHIFL